MRKYVAIFALLLGLLFPLTVAPMEHAVAVKGCYSQVINKVDGWSRDATYPAPTAGGVDDRRVRGLVNAHYQWCPNGTRPGKLKVKFFEYCWTHIDERKSWVWEGMKLNTITYDDFGYINNPPSRYVQDADGKQRCEIYDIPVENEQWASMEASPYWKAHAYIVLNAAPDKGPLEFKTDDFKTYKFFHPSEDRNTSDWHW